jgi:prepilin-type N-terminal cleavage/methylation domain-containing protein
MRSLGFTLIELLVVVLIIGILAAIALPQYKKAVEKSRASEALINLKAIVTALNVYKLTTGSSTTDLNNLDIAIPDSKYYNYQILTNGNPHATKKGSTTNFAYYYKGYSKIYPDAEGFYCNVGMSHITGNPDLTYICRALGWIDVPYGECYGVAGSSPDKTCYKMP